MNKQEVVIRSREDVIRFVNSRPHSNKILLVVLVALGGVFIDAYDFTSLGIGTDQIKEEFSLTPFALGSITAIMAFGALIGAFIGGYLTDKIGRLKMFMLTMVMFVVSALGAALSFNVETLMFFRFMMGLAVGIDFPAAMSFIAEYSNSASKGKNVNLWQPVFYVAACFTGIVALPFYLGGAEETLWRWVVGFGAIPAAIMLILRHKLIDESPMWAARYLSIEEAAQVLRKNYKIKVTVAPEVIKEKKKEKISYRKLFSKKYGLRTLLVSILNTTQAMEYYAVGFYLPTISVLIFGEDFIYAILGAITFNLFGIAGGFVQSRITEKMGVRRLAILGYTGVIISLLILGMFKENIPLYGQALLVGLFIFSHSFGPGAQGLTMATLSYPTEIRGLGTGWAEAMIRVGSMIGFFFFPMVLAAVGLTKMLLWLILAPLLGLLSLLFIKWEPIGQDIEEVDSVEKGQAIGVEV